MEQTMENARYPEQRTSGVWLIYIGLVIIAAALLGGEWLVHPVLLGIGYIAGFLLILGLPYVNRRLAYGKNTAFQTRMDNVALVLNIVLCTACGLWIGFSDLRVLWLSIFIAVGIHFALFYFSLGPWLIALSVLTIANGVLGLALPGVPFLVFALLDGALKMAVGFKLFAQKQPGPVNAKSASF